MRGTYEHVEVGIQVLWDQEDPTWYDDDESDPDAAYELWLENGAGNLRLQWENEECLREFDEQFPDGYCGRSVWYGGDDEGEAAGRRWLYRNER